MHDYTLKKVNIDWQAGEARFVLLDTVSKPVEIIAVGVTELSIPRHSEWGFSASVNDVWVSGLDADQKHLELAMQSGDVLVVKASDIHLP